jgi:hypothetical protein
MGGSSDRELHPAATEGDPATPSRGPAAQGMPVPRSERDLIRALARGDAGTRVGLARTLQQGAGNRAVQRLARRAQMASRQLQRYTECERDGKWKGANPGAMLGRLSDTGETMTLSTHEAYATPELIKQSAGMLDIRGSGVRLSQGSASKTVEAPNGSGTKTLYEIVVDVKADPTNKTMSGDCRETALEVAGTGPGGAERLTITEGGRQVAVEGEKNDAADAAVRALLIDKKVHETANYAALDDAARKKIAEEAQANVGSMTGPERESVRGMTISDDRAKEIGIDAYANAGMGDAFVSVAAPPPGQGGYKFHFAAVIMAPGEDRVTLENEGTEPGTRNTKWKIETYGPKTKRQTFHELHTAITSGGHTFVVRTGPPPPGDSAAIMKMSTPDLFKRHMASSSRDEKLYIEQEMRKRNIILDVNVDHTDDDDEDDVYANVASSTFIQFHTGTHKVKSGGRTQFQVPVNKVWPMTNELTVRVFDWDALSADDLIGIVHWQLPYTPVTDQLLTGESKTARYRVSLQIA